MELKTKKFNFQTASKLSKNARKHFGSIFTKVQIFSETRGSVCREMDRNLITILVSFLPRKRNCQRSWKHELKETCSRDFFRLIIIIVIN